MDKFLTDKLLYYCGYFPKLLLLNASYVKVGNVPSRALSPFVTGDMRCLQSDVNTDEMKRDQMERLVREELERWDSESNIDGGGGSATRRTSPSSASGGRMGVRSANSNHNVSLGYGTTNHLYLPNLCVL